jgi:hypothetical protein
LVVMGSCGGGSMTGAEPLQLSVRAALGSSDSQPSHWCWRSMQWCWCSMQWCGRLVQ